jgi:hypothetical protein
MDILETARLLRFQTDWERRFHEYELLLNAGIDADEAERIVSLVEADRRPVQSLELAA